MVTDSLKNFQSISQPLDGKAAQNTIEDMRTKSPKIGDDEESCFSRHETSKSRLPVVHVKSKSMVSHDQGSVYSL